MPARTMRCVPVIIATVAGWCCEGDIWLACIAAVELMRTDARISGGAASRGLPVRRAREAEKT